MFTNKRRSHCCDDRQIDAACLSVWAARSYPAAAAVDLGPSQKHAIWADWEAAPIGSDGPGSVAEAHRMGGLGARSYHTRTRIIGERPYARL